MKIVLLGGGSLYFEYVMAEIACTPELAGAQVMLYDVDKKRMDLMRRVGLQIAKKTKSGLDIKASSDLAQALDGANFAVASIGVHGPNFSWHKLDSDTVAKFGIIHTTGDTVGPGGFSQGLRIIPIFLDIARKMEKYCPDAILLNHSNPMAAICRAVMKYSSIHTIGYCHGAIGDIHFFSRIMGVPFEELDAVIAGVNHCSWLLRLTHKGKDAMPKLKKALNKKNKEPHHVFSTEFFQLTGMYPLGGDRHVIEFFPHSRIYSKTKKIPYGMQWRTDMINGNMLKKEINKGPDDINLKAAGKKDVWLPKENETTPESMGEQLRALAFGHQKLHLVNTPNHNAVPNLPDWAVLELKAVIGKGGARPIYAGELPAQAARWSLAQIYTNELMVDAAVEKSREKAIMAFACDPMIRDLKEAQKVFDAIVKAQGDRLKVFRAKKSK